MASALKSVKILDLSRLPPGQFCTMMLGDMGAEVIKIELPEGVARPAGSGVSRLYENERKHIVYDALNRNKKSIGLNLKSEEGRHIFCMLARNADVILEGFRPGVVKRLGVDYETIKKINSRIIYCSLSGYGQDGPYRTFPGHDINYIAIGGALSLIGEKDKNPMLPLNLIADYAGGALHAVIGILLAIMAREKSGLGQYVDISMTDGVLSLLTRLASDYFCDGIVPKRGESVASGTSPYNNVYETKDGKFISIGCIEPQFWENLCRLLERDDLIAHQYATGDQRKEIFSFLRTVFTSKSRDEWFELLSREDIPVGKVYTLDEVFSDPQVLHRRMLQQLYDPIEGIVKQIGIAIKLSETPGSVQSLAPMPGQQTEEILSAVGYAQEDIQTLRKEGVVS